ncbi:uncharacterized protein BJ212DRAFT_1328652 [Suillus subaureus]|uniref:Uncharacterized protein n=1 Tax=Suillus subaureus TaxID=48587 RepID=A0A9P7EJD6_9AGAM|nr:uncharacterized protein BJ212DRAFT_1328652 [Suillus subaureus]KAG1822534.1 hypothetical protein BJ212DRAFT_1328652 [Suillus subaureus]
MSLVSLSSRLHLVVLCDPHVQPAKYHFVLSNAFTRRPRQSASFDRLQPKTLDFFPVVQLVSEDHLMTMSLTSLWDFSSTTSSTVHASSQTADMNVWVARRAKVLWSYSHPLA